MSGQDAVRQLLAEAEREEFIAVELLARALRQTRRRVMRDWRKRRQPETHVGREILLASRLVLAIYFPHTLPVKMSQSEPFEPPHL